MLDTIPEILEDIRQGKMVILMDADDRENEGDLIMAAEKVTPEAINFMITHGKGLVCMPLREQDAARLSLELMPRRHVSRFGTKFLTSIEAVEGVTTGISSAERAQTISVAANRSSGPEDLATPGHIFPILAEEGGVLARPGHTEAACDLAQLAGLSPMGVVCEIILPDGSMARRADLLEFAKVHDLKVGTVQALIEYRLKLAAA